MVIDAARCISILSLNPSGCACAHAHAMLLGDPQPLCCAPPLRPCTYKAHAHTHKAHAHTHKAHAHTHTHTHTLTPYQLPASTQASEQLRKQPSTQPHTQPHTQPRTQSSDAWLCCSPSPLVQSSCSPRAVEWTLTLTITQRKAPVERPAMPDASFTYSASLTT